MTQASIFLCHKCAGHLELDAGPSAYACDCLSGYVRDWQWPWNASEVRTLQLAHCQGRASLYAGQGRATTDNVVKCNNARIARLSRNAS